MSDPTNILPQSTNTENNSISVPVETLQQEKEQEHQNIETIPRFAAAAVSTTTTTSPASSDKRQEQHEPQHHPHHERQHHHYPPRHDKFAEQEEDVFSKEGEETQQQKEQHDDKKEEHHHEDEEEYEEEEEEEYRFPDFCHDPLEKVSTPCGYDCGIMFHPGGLAKFFLITCFALAPLMVCMMYLHIDDIPSRVIGSFFAFGMVMCHLVGISIDPGILLPSKIGEEAEIVDENEEKCDFRSGIFYTTEHNLEIELRVCPTCGIVRPARSGHSNAFGACLVQYNHFCKILNMAVTFHRTFRFFYGFHVFLFLLAIFGFLREIVTVSTQFNYSEMWEKGHLERFTIVSAYLIIVIAIFFIWLMYDQVYFFGVLLGMGCSMKDLEGRHKFLDLEAREFEWGRFFHFLFGSMEETEVSGLIDSEFKRKPLELKAPPLPRNPENETTAEETATSNNVDVVAAVAVVVGDGNDNNNAKNEGEEEKNGEQKQQQEEEEENTKLHNNNSSNTTSIEVPESTTTTSSAQPE